MFTLIVMVRPFSKKNFTDSVPFQVAIDYLGIIAAAGADTDKRAQAAVQLSPR